MSETSRTVFELKTYGDGPGYYWCAGHALLNFKTIQSDPIVAYKNLDGKVYAVKIETHCNGCHHYFNDKYIKEMANDFRNYLKDLRKQLKKGYG